MDSIRSKIIDAFNYIYTAGIPDILDMLIVAFLVYKLIGFIRRTSSSKVAKGVVVILLALWLSGELKLTVINFLLRKTVELGLLALVILFQPELRRVLEKMGSGSFSDLFGREPTAINMDMVITQTVIACTEMSKNRIGALIVFERDNPLDDPIRTGTIIDAGITAELLKNIFFPKAPLHDGAVIIRDGRVAAAGCMLPLSTNANLSRDLGMRHRAGIGMSERSDAVVVIVSEESGSISVAVDGMLKRHLATDTFEKLLRNELIPDSGSGKKSSGKWFNFFKVRNNEKNGSSTQNN
jgi:diadenylate cyclase